MIVAAAAAARGFVRRRDLLALIYLVFIALLFLVPNPATARNLFYAVVLGFALVLDRAAIARIAQSWTLRFAALLLLWLWLTLIWSDGATAPQFARLARQLLLILMFVVITAHLVATSPDFGRRLFRWIAYAGALAAAAAVTWAAARSPTLPFIRVGAFPFPNSNASGAVYGTAVAGAFCYLCQRGERGAGAWLDAAAVATMGLFCLLTQNRGSVIALAVTMTVITVTSMRKRMRSMLIALAVAALALGLLLAFGVVDPAPLFQRGDSYRLEAWTHYLDAWRRHPWSGVGLTAMPTFMSTDGLVEIVHPHNIYLSHLVVGGIPALVLLTMMFTAAARAAWRRHAAHDDAGPAALLLFVLLAGLFDYTIFVDAAGWQWLYFWLPIGLIAGTEVASRLPAAAETRAG